MLRNPALENQFKYTPVRVFDLEEDEGKPESGIFNDICTVAVNGEWDNQVFFFFRFESLIIMLMLIIFQKNECASAWPVYLKQGNIAKRRVRQVDPPLENER